MTRRTKLSRSDRAKRAGKRESRREGEDDRRVRRSVRKARERLSAAQGTYVEAIARAEREPGVVCETCGTEQRYVHGGEAGEVALCRRGELLDLLCGGEYAVTAEAFAESAV